MYSYYKKKKERYKCNRKILFYIHLLSLTILLNPFCRRRSLSIYWWFERRFRDVGPSAWYSRHNFIYQQENR